MSCCFRKKKSHIFQTFPKVKLPFLVKQTARTWLYISGNCELCTSLLEMKCVLSHQLPHAILRLQKEFGTSKLPFGEKEEKHMTHTTCHNPPATKIFSKNHSLVRFWSHIKPAWAMTWPIALNLVSGSWWLSWFSSSALQHVQNQSRSSGDLASAPNDLQGQPAVHSVYQSCWPACDGKSPVQAEWYSLPSTWKIKDPDLIQAALHSSNSREPLLEHELHLRHANGSGDMADLGVFWKMMEMHLPIFELPPCSCPGRVCTIAWFSKTKYSTTWLHKLLVRGCLHSASERWILFRFRIFALFFCWICPRCHNMHYISIFFLNLKDVSCSLYPWSAFQEKQNQPRYGRNFLFALSPRPIGRGTRVIVCLYSCPLPGRQRRSDWSSPKCDNNILSAHFAPRLFASSGTWCAKHSSRIVVDVV